MSAVRSTSSVPASLEVFLDARGDGRALRVTWHAEAGVVVFSLWRAGVCAGTFRLPIEDAPALIEMLRGSLEQAYDGARGSFGEAAARYDEARSTLSEELDGVDDGVADLDGTGLLLGRFHTFEDEVG